MAFTKNKEPLVITYNYAGGQSTCRAMQATIVQREAKGFKETETVFHAFRWSPDCFMA